MGTSTKTEKRSVVAARVVVFGVVQGVGFRPFIYRLAKKCGCKGWVKNVGFGVEIHCEAESPSDLRRFLKNIRREKPRLALIEKTTVRSTSFRGYKDFQILKSKKGGSFVFISPDICTCSECLREVKNPQERRFHYPFTNCTDCGPRYTIVKALPYDRGQTTMARFAMCEDCAREYADPLDRRYHAQPIACPVCGPRVTLLEVRTGRTIAGGIEKAAVLVKEGKILAVKGLGGFHLVCDPLNVRAVRRLRKIKSRKTKPLALMALDLRTVAQYASVSPQEKIQLLSARRPIVLLRKKKDIKEIAPDLGEVGIMLPYTPLHYLLLEKLGIIVATSSNPKDAPIIKEKNEGLETLCDYVLDHSRPIQMRADDSVLKIAGGRPLFVRRARGYVPYPQRVPEELRSSRQIIALGGELKDTISVYKNGYVVTSQFLGDLDEYANFRYFEETLGHLCHLFGITQEVVVTDLHPNFRTTRYAQRLGIPHLQVQHHYAHVLASLLEHQISPQTRVLGVSWDGYGYGEDGTAWGGEFLLADYYSYQRFAHFKYIALPGGDLAAKQPWRMAVSYLRATYGENWPRIRALEKIAPSKIRAIMRAMEQNIHSPLASSCGRLFDAVSFLIGVAPTEMEYEAEAAMRLEACAQNPTAAAYDFCCRGDSFPLEIDFAPTIEAIVQEVRSGKPSELISTKFHNTLARVIAAVADQVRALHGIDTVVLGGGVFLNKRLLAGASRLLQIKGFKVLRPESYSPNDESLSLGQIAFALGKLGDKR